MVVIIMLAHEHKRFYGIEYAFNYVHQLPHKLAQQQTYATKYILLILRNIQNDITKNQQQLVYLS